MPEDDTHEADVETITRSIDELQQLFVSLGMPKTLGDLGLMPDDIDPGVRDEPAAEG